MAELDSIDDVQEQSSEYWEENDERILGNSDGRMGQQSNNTEVETSESTEGIRRTSRVIEESRSSERSNGKIQNRDSEGQRIVK